MARTSRRGYTLIEMMVVTVILVLFAALVTPDLVNMRDSQRRRAFYASVVDLAGTAREMAITHHATMYLHVDTSLNQIEIKQEYDDSTYQAADGNNGAMTAPATNTAGKTSTQTLSNQPQSNIATTDMDHSNDTVITNLPLSTGMQFGNFQLAGESSDSSSWKVRFFSDGTSDGGAVELDDKGYVKSLVVNSKGGSSLVDGTIPDTSQERWQAGNYVQRQQ